MGDRCAAASEQAARGARVDDRRAVNGIFWVLRTGSPCRDLPKRYGSYTTFYNCWAMARVWLPVFAALVE